MNQTTAKRLGFLFLMTVLLGVAVYFGRTWQVERMAESVANAARTAEEKQEFARAEALFREHIEVVEDDEIKKRYADLIVKSSLAQERREEALGIYNQLLRANPSNVEIRSRKVELLFMLERFPKAVTELQILLAPTRSPEYKPTPADGHFEYMMGRCLDQMGSDPVDQRILDGAITYYRKAIEHCEVGPDRLEAYSRLATLLRDRREDEEEADEVIESMVSLDPQNYRVYLYRGRYRSQGDPAGAKEDLVKALELAPDKLEVYLELAKVVEKQSTPEAAAQILKKGLERDPRSITLYAALASVYRRANRHGQAMNELEAGLKILESDDDQKELRGVVQLRVLMVELAILARDGAKLDQQIAILKNRRVNPLYLRLFTAHYHVIRAEYEKAVAILVPLRADLADLPEVRTQACLLLANCYANLGDVDSQRQMLTQATMASPDNLSAALAQADLMFRSGDLDGAIQKYQSLVLKNPQLRIPLAKLLLLRNERTALTNQEWIDFNRLVTDATRTGGDPSELAAISSRALLAQDKPQEAEALLKKAMADHPKNPELRRVMCEVLRSRGRLDDALNVLEQSSKELGDTVGFRLERARLLTLQKAPDLPAELEKLERNIENFGTEDRYRLFEGLAVAHALRKDFEATIRLRSQIAQLRPRNLDLRLGLVELLLQAGKKAEVDKELQQIELIEGKGGPVSICSQARYLIWQAQREKDKEKRAALQSAAAALLNGLSDRRKDWSLVSLLQAELAEQELAAGDLDSAQKAEKLDALIGYYLSAIEKGDRQSSVVNRVYVLLRNVGRDTEAYQLINRLSAQIALSGDAGTIAALLAMRSGDFQRAEAIARKAVAANPTDFMERVRLGEVLRTAGRRADADAEFRQAETDLRKSIAAVRSDPRLWTTLIKLMVVTSQLDKAEKDVREAETILAAKSGGMLAMAECCTAMARGYTIAKNDSLVKKWNLEAKGWFEKAHAADPDNLLIAMQMMEFFRQTKQLGQAESYLEAIIKRASGPNSANPSTKGVSIVTWARRTLAELLASKGTKEDVDRALAMLGNVDGRPSSNDAAESRDDQRLLARVLTRQKTLEGRQRAMAILEKLVASEPDNTEDRFLLAQLKDVSGDWPEAHKQYKELIARVKSRQRLVRVIPEFVNRLIEHHENGQSEDLTEAQELVDLLVQMRPDELDPLTLEVKLNRVQNQLVNATALIKKYADRPQVQAATLSSLAGLAEGLVQDLPTVAFTANLKEGSSTVTDVSSMTGVSVGQLVTGPDIPAGTTIASLDSPTSITLSTAAKGTGSRSLNAIDPAAQGAYDLAEQIHQRIAKLDNFRGTLGQVGFLGRRGRVTEALDLCEPLWQIAREPAQVVGLAVAVVRVVLGSSNSVDPSQIKRAIDWLNQASAQNPQLAVLLTMLGNLKESQGSYSEAEGLYRRSIDQGDDGGIASNNLAWLLALKDGKVKEALEHVNRAINLRGPRPDFLDTRGVIEFIGDDNDNAIKDLKAAIAVDPSPAKYFHLAQVYSKIGKIDDAKTNLEAAKVKGYKQSGLHELEQEAYEKLRRNLGMK